MKKRGTFIWVLAAFLWIGLIFLLSSRTGHDSNETSRSMATVMSRIFIPDYSAWGPSTQSDWIEGINNLLRKMAHIFEFGMLGILVYRMMVYFAGSIRRKKPANKFSLGMGSFYICALVSALDEFIQRSSAGRNASTTDMMIDIAGAILGIVVCSYLTELPDAYQQRRRSAHRRG